MTVIRLEVKQKLLNFFLFTNDCAPDEACCLFDLSKQKCLTISLPKAHFTAVKSLNARLSV